MSLELAVEIRALEIFRRRYGIWANPEDYPGLWEICLNIAAEQLEEGQ